MLALSTIYYGGDAYQEGGNKAKAAQLAGEVQQIQSAIELFKSREGRLPTSMAELTANQEYLKEAPNSAWVSSLSFIQTNQEGKELNEDVCLAFNKGRGIPFVPSCSDPYYKNSIVCCKEDPIEFE